MTLSCGKKVLRRTDQNRSGSTILGQTHLITYISYFSSRMHILLILAEQIQLYSIHAPKMDGRDVRYFFVSTAHFYTYC